MYFRMLHDDASGAVSYLLADLDTRECVLVDPQASDVAVFQAMLGEYRLNLRWLLRTHEHGASLSDDAAALDSLGAPEAQPSEADTMVFGNELLRAMPTPGHTAGCVSFLWRDRLFCGDLLTVDACPHQPRPALPEALWDSVTRQVLTLPGETLLFCSHAAQGRSVSNVLEQRRWHPWFGGGTRDEFLARLRTPTAGTNSLPFRHPALSARIP